MESGWSWGLGFGFPQILGKCFSGSPSPCKHTYLFLLSLYTNKYIIVLYNCKWLLSNLDVALWLPVCMGAHSFHCGWKSFHMIQGSYHNLHVNSCKHYYFFTPPALQWPRRSHHRATCPKRTVVCCFLGCWAVRGFSGGSLWQFSPGTWAQCYGHGLPGWSRVHFSAQLWILGRSARDRFW